jgi:hypothetical protein
MECWFLVCITDTVYSGKRQELKYSVKSDHCNFKFNQGLLMEPGGSVSKMMDFGQDDPGSIFCRGWYIYICLPVQ